MTFEAVEEPRSPENFVIRTEILRTSFERKKFTTYVKEYTKTRVHKTSFELSPQKSRKNGKKKKKKRKPADRSSDGRIIINQPSGHWALLEIIRVAMQPR